MRPIIPTLLALFASLALMACDRGTAPSDTRSGGLNVSVNGEGQPVPLLAFDKPAAPPALLDGRNLRETSTEQLRVLSRQAEARQDYPRAAILQHWLTERTAAGRYDLACDLARTGKTDPAFYWLQAAARDEGVDPDHAATDEDLATLRADPRWSQVDAYLRACSRYWESHGTARTALVVPSGYQKGTPITVVVYLHGLGSKPEDFVNERCQRYADALNIAIVGVSGTLPRGPDKFVWAVDPERDARRVRDALAEVADRVTVKPGHVIALGFSQGAQVGLEIAVRNPEEFAGAIVLSPGARSQLRDLPQSPLLTRRGFVVACGAKEAPGNVRLTESDADWLRGANAPVREKEYPGIAEHAFPPDFHERFPDWVRFIEQVRGE